jgi:hypothetical protein
VGLGIKVVVRHHEGEEDLLCPSAWCDVCGEELVGETQDGFSDMYAFVHPSPDGESYKDFREGRGHVPMLLVHGGRCFESIRDEEGHTLPHMPTDYLIVHLSQNMGKGTSEEDWLKLHRWVVKGDPEAGPTSRRVRE